MPTWLAELIREALDEGVELEDIANAVEKLRRLREGLDSSTSS